MTAIERRELRGVVRFENPAVEIRMLHDLYLYQVWSYRAKCRQLGMRPASIARRQSRAVSEPWKKKLRVEIRRLTDDFLRRSSIPMALVCARCGLWHPNQPDRPHVCSRWRVLLRKVGVARMRWECVR